MLKDPKASGKKVVYTVVTRGKALGRAVRTKRWRYALWPDGEELYDLENDIEEYFNLAASKKDMPMLKTMRTHLAHAESKAASKAL